MSKIDSGKINYGNPLVINHDGSSVNKEISDAQIIADSIIAEAKKKAAQIMAQAQNEAGQIVSQAISDAENSKENVLADSKEQGYEDGYKAGQQKIISEMIGLIENVDNFVKCKFEAKHRIIRSLHNDILEMVLTISEKICKTELQSNKETLTKIVTHTLSLLKEKENVTIIVNPEMSEKIYQISDELKTRIHNLENIKIIEDTAVAPDGTIVESVGSRIDARVSTQIEQIAKRLFAELNSTSETELERELLDVPEMQDEPEIERTIYMPEQEMRENPEQENMPENYGMPEMYNEPNPYNAPQMPYGNNDFPNYLNNINDDKPEQI